MVENKEKLNSLLMKMTDESEKAGLKLNIQKNNNNNIQTHIMPSSTITSR